MKNLENFQNDLIDSECLVGGEIVCTGAGGCCDTYDTETGETTGNLDC